MSSILTNDGAMIALQTLKSINSELATTQQEIATGKKVSRSGDNAAVWAIAKTMEADVAGFKKVSDSLSLGQATLSVARQGAETVTDLLTEVKGKVVAAQEGNVDRAKIQTDIEALTEQIGAIVSSAAFNGQNLLSNSDSEAGSGSINILGSIDRQGSDLSFSDINVRKRDLATNASSISTTGGTYGAADASFTANGTQSGTIDVSALTVEAGTAFNISIFGTDANGSAFTQADFRTSAAATQTQAEMALSDLAYVAREGDTMSDVVDALGKKWDTYAESNNIDSDVLNLEFSGTDIEVSSSVTSALDNIAVNVNTLSADAGNTIGGGLEDLGSMDVSTEAGASAALATIEGLLDTAIGSAASFGSDQGRLDTQANFISGMSDAVKAGIGKLVDTDLEEASARLQALQVQQQLAIQSLSIANGAPQVLLGLFR